MSEPRFFYATVKRGERIARLAGPYASEPEARAALDWARARAEEVNAKFAFDAFGTIVYEQDCGPGAFGTGEVAPCR